MDNQREEGESVKTTAKIGPTRAVESGLFAPPRKYDGDKKEAEAEQQQRAKINLPVTLVSQLRHIIPSDYERQNVLTYTVETYSTQMRVEYMAFAEDLKIDHCWLGLLSWWNHRHHDKETQYNIILQEKLRIEAFNGVEKVMGVARAYTPTSADTETVCSIMKEHMTGPYRHRFECYLRRYSIPKCLRILKLWLWDVQDGQQQPPDAAEDTAVRLHRIKHLLTISHNYDGVSKFPRLTRRNRRMTDIDVMMAVHDGAGRYKRSYQQSLPKRRCGSKIQKVELSDDEAGEGSITPPPPPMPTTTYEPVTPPPPPPPQDDDSDNDRPPRLSRPPPTDPRVNRHHQGRPPVSPASVMTNKEQAGRKMGLDSYVVESVVRHMSQDDWYEFLMRRKYGKALIQELQAFLNEKYCNEEHTQRQQHYGELCNRAMYPLYYPPYELDISAKAYHMKHDGEVPSPLAWSRPQKRTFFRREFGGGVFPVYVSDEEYDRMMFTEREFCAEDHSQPTGYFNTHTLVENPAKYALRTLDEYGNEVNVRNTPRYEEELVMNIILLCVVCYIDVMHFESIIFSIFLYVCLYDCISSHIEKKGNSGGGYPS